MYYIYLQSTLLHFSRDISVRKLKTAFETLSSKEYFDGTTYFKPVPSDQSEKDAVSASFVLTSLDNKIKCTVEQSRLRLTIYHKEFDERVDRERILKLTDEIAKIICFERPIDGHHLIEELYYGHPSEAAYRKALLSEHLQNMANKAFVSFSIDETINELRCSMLTSIRDDNPHNLELWPDKLVVGIQTDLSYHSKNDTNTLTYPESHTLYNEMLPLTAPQSIVDRIKLNGQA